jgi:hypothetical protein
MALYVNKSIVEIILGAPQLTQKVDWLQILESTVSDYVKYERDYYHTIDPDGNVILFKKVLFAAGGNKINYDYYGIADVKKNPVVGLYYPIGYYTTNHENNYVLVNTTQSNPLEVLQRVDLTATNPTQLVGMISGMVQANQSSNMPETFDMLEFQNQMRGILGLRENPSVSQLFNYVGAEVELILKLEQVVGEENVMKVFQNIETLIKYVHGITKIDSTTKEFSNPQTKLFQNSLFAEEPNHYQFSKQFDANSNIISFKLFGFSIQTLLISPFKENKTDNFKQIEKEKYRSALKKYYLLNNKRQLATKFGKAIETNVMDCHYFIYVDYINDLKIFHTTSVKTSFKNNNKDTINEVRFFESIPEIDSITSEKRISGIVDELLGLLIKELIDLQYETVQTIKPNNDTHQKNLSMAIDSLREEFYFDEPNMLVDMETFDNDDEMLYNSDLDNDQQSQEYWDSL